MAADTQKDPWETGSGMVDDVDGTLTECFFGVDEKYNADAVLFCGTLVDDSGEEITLIKYSVGDGWVTNQDGSEISHPTKSQINKSTRFGYFIERLVKANTEKAPGDAHLQSPAGKDKGLGLKSVLSARGNPFQAKTFEGLKFHWDLHKGWTMGKDKETGENIWKDVLFPTRYLGEVTGKATAAAPANAAKAAPAATAAAPAATNGGLTKTLSARLQILALQNDIKSFTKAVIRDKEVTALPEDVLAHLLDGSAEGFHAQANA